MSGVRIFSAARIRGCRSRNLRDKLPACDKPFLFYRTATSEILVLIQRIAEYVLKTEVVRLLRLTEKQYNNIYMVSGESDYQEKQLV